MTTNNNIYVESQRPVAVRVVGISDKLYDQLEPAVLAERDGKDYYKLSEDEQLKYNQLSRQEKQKYEQPIPEDELNKLLEGVRKIEERRKQLFTSVMDIPEVDWLVEGIAVRDGITLLFGDAGIGKTSLMLQLIGCVTEGREFLGLSTQSGETLLIEQDEGKPLLRSHIERMLPEYPSLRRLEVPAVQILWDNNATDFQVKGSLLKELVRYSSASLVIIDSVTSLGIVDINHPGSAMVFDKIRQLADMHHCAFILLHHPNKSGDVMGSNLIKAKVDCLIQMERTGEAVKLIPLKVRGESFREMILHLDQETLTFRQVPLRDDWIWQLHSEGKQPKEIADIVSMVYPNTTPNNVSVIISRRKK